MTREPDPFSEMDQRANEPIHECPRCEAEVSRRGVLCGDCGEEDEREAGPIHDTWEEARGER
jgi:hypothetical protein